VTGTYLEAVTDITLVGTFEPDNMTVIQMDGVGSARIGFAVQGNPEDPLP
jgi:hypothetical protein